MPEIRKHNEHKCKDECDNIELAALERLIRPEYAYNYEIKERSKDQYAIYFAKGLLESID